MKFKLDSVKGILIIVAYIICLGLFIWGMTCLAKYVSWHLFYEDYVREIIREMVDKKYLIKGF